MKRSLMTSTTTLAALVLTTAALGGDAATSASAGSNSLRRNGDASATANYNGRAGFARTDTRSGSLNTARGVAVGVDRNGLSLSVSNAVAPRLGPGLATNFNLTIDRHGNVSKSRGLAVATGPISRSVTAAGSTGSGRSAPSATSIASGRSDRFGQVRATSHSASTRPTLLRRSPLPLRRAVVRRAGARVLRIRR